MRKHLFPLLLAAFAAACSSPTGPLKRVPDSTCFDCRPLDSLPAHKLPPPAGPLRFPNP